MRFPLFPKRKADAISNGVFLILLGVLFYTQQWWPGLLFAIGLSFAIRQYLTGRRVSFFITLLLIGLVGVLTIAGKMFSLLFPILFIGLGVCLIAKECFSWNKSPWNSQHFNE